VRNSARALLDQQASQQPSRRQLAPFLERDRERRFAAPPERIVQFRLALAHIGLLPV